MTEAESVPQDAREEEERVLEFIATCPEGASYFTVTTELGIARTRAVSILERLHRDGRLSYDCKTKMYYPRPEKKPDPAPSMIEVPEPKAEEPKKCQYCGNIVEKYLWQHEQFCKENPNARKLGQKAKKKEELAEASGPSSAPEQEPTIVPIVEAPFIREKPPLDLASIDDTVPPLSAVQKVAAIMPMAEVESNNVQEPVPRQQQTPSNEVKPLSKPQDPLALFAEKHTKTLSTEIRKMRKAEKRPRRRSAAAEAMAERIHGARLTKERELRRFDRELREMA